MSLQNAHSDSCLAFLIALKAQSVSKDWDQTSYFLEKTLCSILRQNDPRFFVTVVCHDRPRLPDFVASRIYFLEVDFDRPGPRATIWERRTDKLRKQALALKSISKKLPSHYMFVDADDMVSVNTTSLALSSQTNSVKIMKIGYVLDEKTKQIWLVDRFSSLCGTCGIFPFDQDMIRRLDRNISALDAGGDSQILCNNNVYSLVSHTKWAKCAQEAGLQVSQITTPHVVYRWNYGDQTNNPRVFRLSTGKLIRRHLPAFFSRGKRWKPVIMTNTIRREFCLI